MEKPSANVEGDDEPGTKSGCLAGRACLGERAVAPLEFYTEEEYVSVRHMHATTREVQELPAIGTSAFEEESDTHQCRIDLHFVITLLQPKQIRI